MTPPPHAKAYRGQKHKNLTFEGRRFRIRSSLFLRLKQILKAVAMGVVALFDWFFWSNAANPAIGARALCTLLGLEAATCSFPALFFVVVG